MEMSENGKHMTPKQKFIMALEANNHRAEYRILNWFLFNNGSFRQIHPTHRHFQQWDQMSACEKDLHRRDIANTYLQIADRYEHSAVFYHVLISGRKISILIHSESGAYSEVF